MIIFKFNNFDGHFSLGPLVNKVKEPQVETIRSSGREEEDCRGIGTFGSSLWIAALSKDGHDSAGRDAEGIGEWTGQYLHSVLCDGLQRFLSDIRRVRGTSGEYVSERLPASG